MSIKNDNGTENKKKWPKGIYIVWILALLFGGFLGVRLFEHMNLLILLMVPVVLVIAIIVILIVSHHRHQG